MGQVPPIHGFSDEIPHLPPVLPTVPSPVNPAAVTPEDPVDTARMGTDPAYVSQVLNWILYRARTSFQAFQYAQARFHYDQYFKYLVYYGGNNIYSTPVNYVPALFERVWATELEGDVQEAKRVLNLEVLKTLELAEKSSWAVGSTFVQQVETHTAQSHLPSAANMYLSVAPQVLQELAHQAQMNQQPALAVRLLGLAQVAAYLEVYRAQRHAVEIEQAETGHPVPYSALPFGYRHFGVPVAPILPQPPDMAQRVAPQVHVDPYYVDKVEPVYGINKDPRDAEGRRKRKSKKGKTQKTRKKPPLTF